MENNVTWLPYSNFSGNNSSYIYNKTEPVSQIYLFTPAGVTAKRLLSSILSITGGMGFLGNCFIFYFLWKKPKRNPIQSSPFMRNLSFYVRSLSLSDLLSCAVSLPLLLIQISFDVFQSGWACKIVRYFNFAFPVVTTNNLVVISLEKYLSTRTVPRTFSVSTVRKMIICAWVWGTIVVVFPAASYDGIKVELNKTHYTEVCLYKLNFYPFRLSLILFVLQYVLPSIFVTYVNLCLLKTLWERRSRQIGNGANNAFRANLRSASIKGTTLLVALTFSFIIPFFFYFGHTAYTQAVKPQRDFPTDYMMRYGTGGVVYLGGALNFIIYFAQMKDFRQFLKKLLSRAKAPVAQDLDMERQNTARRRPQLATIEL